MRAEHLHVSATNGAVPGTAPSAAHSAASGEVDRAGNGAARVRAQVLRIEILSDQRLVHLALSDGAHELISAAPADATLEPGAHVNVELRRVLWFDAAGERVAG